MLLLLVDVAVMDLDSGALSVARVIVVLSDNVPVFGNGASANEERDNGTVQQSSTHEQLMHSLARSYTLANRVRRGVVSRGRKSSRKDEAVLLSCDIIGARYSLVCDIYYPCCSFDILLVHCFAGSTSAGRPTAHVDGTPPSLHLQHSSSSSSQPIQTTTTNEQHGSPPTSTGLCQNRRRNMRQVGGGANVQEAGRA